MTNKDGIFQRRHGKWRRRTPRKVPKKPPPDEKDPPTDPPPPHSTVAAANDENEPLSMAPTDDSEHPEERPLLLPLMRPPARFIAGRRTRSTNTPISFHLHHSASTDLLPCSTAGLTATSKTTHSSKPCLFSGHSSHRGGGKSPTLGGKPAPFSFPEFFLKLVTFMLLTGTFPSIATYIHEGWLSHGWLAHYIFGEKKSYLDLTLLQKLAVWAPWGIRLITPPHFFKHIASS